MRETIKRLQVLQELDAVIHGIELELEDKPRRMREIQEELDRKNAEIEEKQALLKETEAQKNNQEQMLFIEQDKLKKTRARLTGSNVRNTSAYYANQREIEKLKKDADSIESSLLQNLQTIDDLNKSMETLGQDVEKLNSELREAEEQTSEAIANLQSDLEKQLARRKELVIGIDREILGQYERIHKHFPENTICKALNEMCTGCQMRMPPQLYNEILRGDKIHQCPACRRILYYQEEESIAAEAGGS